MSQKVLQITFSHVPTNKTCVSEYLPIKLDFNNIVKCKYHSFMLIWLIVEIKRKESSDSENCMCVRAYVSKAIKGCVYVSVSHWDTVLQISAVLKTEHLNAPCRPVVYPGEPELTIKLI